MSRVADIPLDAVNQPPVPGARPPAQHIITEDEGVTSDGLIILAYGQVLMGNPLFFDRAG